MKSTSEYIQLLRQYMSSHAGQYGITRMGIFGSVARGEHTEDSDVDICFEAPAPNLFTLAHIKYELEAVNKTQHLLSLIAQSLTLLFNVVKKSELSTIFWIRLKACHCLTEFV